MDGSSQNLVASQAQTDCRYFSGYKPCGKNAICSQRCPFKATAGRRILIIHLEALGAVLRATSILRAVKRKWPDSHVTWVTSPAALGLLENNPFIDRLIKNDHAGMLALSALNFQSTFIIDKSLVAAGIARVPVDCGEQKGFGVNSQTGAIMPLNPQATRLYELGISNHEKFFVNDKSENRLLIEALDLEFQNDEYVFEFSETEKSAASSQREEWALKAGVPVIGFNTGCSGTIPYKKLSVRGWLDLIKLTRVKFPQAHLVLLGGPEDTERNAEIEDSLEFKVINSPTDRGVRQGMISASLCDIIVTGDSLGLHMGIALKKWIVAWFGPTCAHEIDFYGRGTAIKTQAPCSPCWKRVCDKQVMCYDQVDWSQITQGIKLGLSKRASRAPEKTPEKLIARSEKLLALR